MTSPWLISESAALERDKKATDKLVSIILIADSNRRKHGVSALTVKAAVMRQGYSLKEIKRLLPLLEASVGKGQYPCGV
jgi:hypothetical protein